MTAYSRHLGHRHVPDDGTMIRLIGTDGSQVGIVTMGAAKTMARSAGLDAVMVNASGDPPVVRLADSGRIKYEEEKKRRRARRNSSNGVKEIRLSVDIGEHDLGTKTRQAAGFLDHGDSVQLTMVMRGRKQSRPQVAAERLERIAASLTDGREGCLVSPQSRSGNRFICMITPRRRG